VAGFLEGVVTFATNGDRTRFRNAAENYVSSWNAAHPEALFTGTTTVTTFEGLRAVRLSYTNPSYDAIDEAHRMLYLDATANLYLDIVNLSTGNTG
jgi:hypothetical protein